MSVHRYPRREIMACYLRAALGTILTAGPVILGKPVAFLSVILLGLATIFIGYGVSAFLRGNTRYHLSDVEITADGLLHRRIPWSDLSALSLSYYATKSDRTGGWMQLKLKGAGQSIRIESSLEGFSEIVTRAVAAARQRDIELSPPTLENLRPLGLEQEVAAPCPTS